MNRASAGSRTANFAAIVAAAIGWHAMGGIAFGHFPVCDGTCPPLSSGVRRCKFGCSELAYRTAIKSANSCASGPVHLEFDASLCSPCTATDPPYIDCCGPTAIAGGCSQDQFDCYIDIANAAGETLETCHPVDKAACLTGSDTILDGTMRMVLQWSGAREQPAVELCSEDPDSSMLRSPVRIRGNHNQVVRLAIQYFTDGLKVVEGDGHKIRGLWAERICDDAVDVPGILKDGNGQCAPTAQSNVRIEQGFFRGLTLADYTPTGFWCVDSSLLPAPCGLGKAVQVNGGINVTVRDSEFKSMSVPVRICTIGGGLQSCGALCPFGPNAILNNKSDGLPPGAAAEVCDYDFGEPFPLFCEGVGFSISADGYFLTKDCANGSLGLQIGETGTLTTVDSNTVMYSRWGMQVEAGAHVRATRNVFKMNHGAGIGISDTAARVLIEQNTFALNGCNDDVQVSFPGQGTVEQNGGHVVLTKFRRGSEAGFGVAPSNPSHVDLGGGDRNEKGVFSPSTYDCTNFGQPDYLANCSFGANRFCRDPNRSFSIPLDEEIINSTTNGIGGSVGVGNVFPSCVGYVAQTATLVGRAVSQVNASPTGTRCTTSVLSPSTSPQNCLIDFSSSCDCTTVFP